MVSRRIHPGVAVGLLAAGLTAGCATTESTTVYDEAPTTAMVAMLDKVLGAGLVLSNCYFDPESIPKYMSKGPSIAVETFDSAASLLVTGEYGTQVCVARARSLAQYDEIKAAMAGSSASSPARLLPLLPPQPTNILGHWPPRFVQTGGCYGVFGEGGCDGHYIGGSLFRRPGFKFAFVRIVKHSGGQGEADRICLDAHTPAACSQRLALLGRLMPTVVPYAEFEWRDEAKYIYDDESGFYEAPPAGAVRALKERREEHGSFAVYQKLIPTLYRNQIVAIDRVANCKLRNFCQSALARARAEAASAPGGSAWELPKSPQKGASGAAR